MAAARIGARDAKPAARGGFAGEGFGIVYLEADAYGKPVVAGNVGGALDSVVDGETGLLVDPSDHVAVAEALTRLLLDRDLAAQLGGAGARRAQEFAWPLICERVGDVLRAQLGLPKRAEDRHSSDRVASGMRA